MQKMAMQMDPSKLAALGLDPAAAKQAQEQFSSLSPEDMARAREQVRLHSTPRLNDTIGTACSVHRVEERDSLFGLSFLERQMKNMTPEEMQKQFQQQQSTMAGQRDYYYKARACLYRERKMTPKRLIGHSKTLALRELDRVRLNRHDLCTPAQASVMLKNDGNDLVKCAASRSRLSMC